MLSKRTQHNFLEDLKQEMRISNWGKKYNLTGFQVIEIEKKGAKRREKATNGSRTIWERVRKMLGTETDPPTITIAYAHTLLGTVVRRRGSQGRTRCRSTSSSIRRSIRNRRNRQHRRPITPRHPSDVRDTSPTHPTPTPGPPCHTSHASPRSRQAPKSIPQRRTVTSRPVQLFPRANHTSKP